MGDQLILVLYEILFPNGKRYFGITKDFEKRKVGHRKDAERKGHLPVHCAIRKYGFENLQFILRAIGDEEYIKQLEISAIAAWNTTNRRFGYNVTEGGEGTKGAVFGAIIKEVLARPDVRKRHLDAIRDPNTRARVGAGSRAAQQDPVVKERQRAGTKAALERPEVKAKLGIAARRYWRLDPLIWITDGIVNRRIHASSVIPEGWRRGLVQTDAEKEANVQRRSSNKATALVRPRLWITDGVSSTRLLVGDAIPEGWRTGRTVSVAAGLAVSAGKRALRQKWITDGVSNRVISGTVELPNGWRYGRSL